MAVSMWPRQLTCVVVYFLRESTVTRFCLHQEDLALWFVERISNVNKFRDKECGTTTVQLCSLILGWKHSSLDLLLCVTQVLRILASIFKCTLEQLLRLAVSEWHLKKTEWWNSRLIWTKEQTNSVAWVRELLILTERTPLVGEVSASFLRKQFETFTE
jgi:hypothetical protein